MEELDNEKKYTKEKKTIDILLANKLALHIMGIAIIFLGIPFYVVWKPVFDVSWHDGLLFFLLFLLGIVLHELIHGLFFGIYAKSGFKSISFGFMRETLTPYCHCKEPLILKHYLIGALMPALLLGIVPVVVSFFIGSAMWLLLGIFFTASAAGDFMVAWILRKESPSTFIKDHPSEAGCWVYKKV